MARYARTIKTGDKCRARSARLRAATGVVTGGLVLILNRLPPGGGFPTQVHDAALYFGHALAYVNFILPVDALVWCISIVLLVKMTLWAFHIAMVVLNFLRGVPTAPYRWEAPGTDPYVSGAAQSARFWG